MDQLTFDLQNIAAGQGLDLAVTGMAIVFSALTLISLFIRGLPGFLVLIGRLLPAEEDPHPAASTATDETDLIAAIGFALHREFVS